MLQGISSRIRHLSSVKRPQRLYSDPNFHIDPFLNRRETHRIVGGKALQMVAFGSPSTAKAYYGRCAMDEIVGTRHVDNNKLFIISISDNNDE